MRFGRRTDLVQVQLDRYEQYDSRISVLAERVDALGRLTDAKFVTYRTLIDSQSEKVALALNSSDKAVSKAELATEKRFEGVNEFRQQLADQAATFMPRAEFEARLDAVVEKMEALADLHRRDMTAVRDMADHLDSAVDDRVKILETATANFQGRLWALGTVLALVVVVVNIAVRFI